MNESILNSDPDARNKMDPAQLDAVARKLDAVAPLRELEDLMRLMTDRQEKVNKSLCFFHYDNSGFCANSC